MIYLMILMMMVMILWWLTRVVYSIYFSPLKTIPSPWYLQLFPIYMQYRMAKGDAPFFVHELFLEYGPIFRVGWNLVLMVDPQACTEIYATYQYSKDHTYDMFSYFGHNVLSTQDRTLHRERKRKVAPAFTRGAVANMEPATIEVGIKPLMKNFQMAADEDGLIDIYQQFHFFSWDVVGRLAFGKSFHMLINGHHPVVKWLDGLVVYGVLGILFPFLRRFTHPDGERLRKFANEVLDRHYANKSNPSDPVINEPTKQSNHTNPHQDIISHFMGGEDPLPRSEVLSESFVQLFAGTDSTSNTLTWFFYLILKHPHVMEKIEEELEIRKLLHPNRILESHDLMGLPYFEAAMKESMRVLPVVAVTPFRIVPEGGRTIMNHYLPAGTTVAIPLYSLHHSPQLWSKCDEFLPDRWLHPSPPPYGPSSSSSTTTTNTSIDARFMPFLMGPRGCIGKDLAWLELTLVALNLIAHYHLRLPTITTTVTPIALPTLRPQSQSLLLKIRHRHPKSS